MFDLVMLNVPRKIRAARLLMRHNPRLHLSQTFQLLESLPSPIAVDITHDEAQRIEADCLRDGICVALVPALGTCWPEQPGPTPHTGRSTLLSLRHSQDHPRTKTRHLLRHQPADFTPHTPDTGLDTMRDLVYTAASAQSPWWRRRRAWHHLTHILEHPDLTTPLTLDYIQGHLDDLPPMLRTPTRANPTRWHLLRHLSADLHITPAQLTQADLTHIEALDLSLTPKGHALCGALIHHTPTKNLTRLGLAGARLTHDGLQDLAQSGHLDALTHLDLRGNNLEDRALKLLDIPHFRALQWLDLSNNTLSGEGLRNLRVIKLGQALTNLGLSHTRLGDPGAERLASHPTQIQTLRLDNIGLSPKGLETLLGHNNLTDLHTLSASFNPIAGAELSPTQATAELRALSLNATGLDPHTIAALWRRAPTPHLETLDLAHNQLTDASVALLASTLHSPRLLTLNLAHNQLTERATAALAIAEPFANLQTLLLGNNHLGAASIHTLSQGLTHLQTLDLGTCDLGDQGLATLATAPWCRALNELGLWHNHIGPAGVRALIQAPLDALTRLYLQANPLGDAGLSALLEAPWTDHLEELHLSATHITDLGVARLARSTTIASLAFLDLSHNDITDAGAAHIAASPGLAQVTMIQLRGNPITDAGLAHLAGSEHLAPWQWSFY